MQEVITDEQAKRYIAENIQRRMTALGWSQRDLAKATKESDMRVSLAVRGIKCPSAAFLARIAEALETTVDDLLSMPRKNSRQPA